MKEENKISSFLSLLDKRIQTQIKIIEDLKKLKSAIIETSFYSPFEHFPQTYSLLRLTDFTKRITKKNNTCGISLVLTIAANYGLVSQEEYFNKSVASNNLSNYTIINKDDFAYNKSYSREYPWGAIKRLNNYPTGILSPLYYCFSINKHIVDSDYLMLYFESTKWHRQISDIAGEGARNHGLLNIAIPDFFNSCHVVPPIETQRKISKYLMLLLDKIQLEEKTLSLLNLQKKYLLQTLFI